jgi:hypothetical protein
VTSPTNEGRNTNQPVGRWQLPALPLCVLLVSVLVGVIGFAWAQRGAFYRVAQNAILTEQDDAHPRSAENRIEASVGWHFVANGTAGPALVATFDIPATGTAIQLSMRKNMDATLPASHLIEVVTSLPKNLPGKAIADIGELVVKLGPEADGVPLIGDVTKVSDGVFWIGLSAVPSNTEVNLRLLELGAFFDLPLTYKSGQHATLTFEKGRTGVAAFEQALAVFRR